MKFTQHQFQQWDGIHRQTEYPIHSHISVILIFLLRTTLIVLGLFCMLYSDILFVLIVVLELERVLCNFTPTFPSSLVQVITKVEPHKFLELVWTVILKIQVQLLASARGFGKLIFYLLKTDKSWYFAQWCPIIVYYCTWIRIPHSYQNMFVNKSCMA